MPAEELAHFSTPRITLGRVLLEPFMHETMRAANDLRTPAPRRDITKESKRFHSARRPERARVLRVDVPAAYGDAPCILAWKGDKERAPILRCLIYLAREDGIDCSEHAWAGHGAKYGMLFQTLQMRRPFDSPGRRGVAANANIGEHLPRGLAHRRCTRRAKGLRHSRPSVLVKMLDQFHIRP